MLRKVIVVAVTGMMPLCLVEAAGPPREPSAPVTTVAAITYLPPVDDFYPAASKIAGETGVVGVLACYGYNGRMVTVTVDKPSRYPRLDAAARKLARQVRVQPGTRNGRVASGCISLPIAFRLPVPESEA